MSPALRDNVQIYIPFQKVDEDQRMCVGYATTEALDSDGERVASQAVENAWPDYMKFANLREMHQAIAAGKVLQADFDEKGPKIHAKVVDDNAWRKVKEKVYTGFSIGGKVKERHGEWVTAIDINEISLVDRPANPEAVFELVKFQKGDGNVDKQDMRIKEQALEILQQVAGGIRNVAKSVRMNAPIKKGLGTAVAFLDQIAGLKFLCDMIEAEEMHEGHKGYYDELKENVADISGTAGAYVMEQLAEANGGSISIPIGDAPNSESDVASAYNLAEGVEKMAGEMEKAGKTFTKAKVEQLENLNREIKKMDLQTQQRPDKGAKPVTGGTGWQKAWGPEPEGWEKMDDTAKAGMVKIAEGVHKAAKMDDPAPDPEAEKKDEGWKALADMMDEQNKTAMEGEADEDKRTKMGEDHKRRMGYMERAYKMDPADEKPEAEKMAKVAGEKSDALKKLATATVDLKKSQERVTELEAMDKPAKAKQRIFALSKGEDIGDGAVDGLKKRQTDAESKGKVGDLLKMVHAGEVSDGLPMPERPEKFN